MHRAVLGAQCHAQRTKGRQQQRELPPWDKAVVRLPGCQASCCRHSRSGPERAGVMCAADPLLKALPLFCQPLPAAAPHDGAAWASALRKLSAPLPADVWEAPLDSVDGPCVPLRCCWEPSPLLVGLPSRPAPPAAEKPAPLRCSGMPVLPLEVWARPEADALSDGYTVDDVSCSERGPSEEDAESEDERRAAAPLRAAAAAMWERAARLERGSSGCAAFALPPAHPLRGGWHMLRLRPIYVEQHLM